MEPKDVVRRFLDHGMTDGQWNMDVIDECFDDHYFSRTWQGDLAHTGARQGRFSWCTARPGASATPVRCSGSRRPVAR